MPKRKAYFKDIFSSRPMVGFRLLIFLVGVYYTVSINMKNLLQYNLKIYLKKINYKAFAFCKFYFMVDLVYRCIYIMDISKYPCLNTIKGTTTSAQAVGLEDMM